MKKRCKSAVILLNYRMPSPPVEDFLATVLSSASAILVVPLVRISAVHASHWYKETQRPGQPNKFNARNNRKMHQHVATNRRPIREQHVIVTSHDRTQQLHDSQIFGNRICPKRAAGNRSVTCLNVNHLQGPTSSRVGSATNRAVWTWQGACFVTKRTAGNIRKKQNTGGVFKHHHRTNKLDTRKPNVAKNARVSSVPMTTPTR